MYKVGRNQSLRGYGSGRFCSYKLLAHKNAERFLIERKRSMGIQLTVGPSVGPNELSTR